MSWKAWRAAAPRCAAAGPPLTLQLCVQRPARLPRRLLPLLERQDGQRPLRADFEVLSNALRAPAAGRAAGEECRAGWHGQTDPPDPPRVACTAAI